MLYKDLSHSDKKKYKAAGAKMKREYAAAFNAAADKAPGLARPLFEKLRDASRSSDRVVEYLDAYDNISRLAETDPGTKKIFDQLLSETKKTSDRWGAAVRPLFGLH